MDKFDEAVFDFESIRASFDNDYVSALKFLTLSRKKSLDPKRKENAKRTFIEYVRRIKTKEHGNKV